MQMFNRSNTNLLENEQKDMVPLTPEVAREIEKLLAKNADALEEVMARHKAGRDLNDMQPSPRTTKLRSYGTAN
jgi:hypothetical protein